MESNNGKVFSDFVHFMPHRPLSATAQTTDRGLRSFYRPAFGYYPFSRASLRFVAPMTVCRACVL
jgi:hypothetical protein